MKKLLAIGKENASPNQRMGKPQRASTNKLNDISTRLLHKPCIPVKGKEGLYSLAQMGVYLRTFKKIYLDLDRMEEDGIHIRTRDGLSVGHRLEIVHKYIIY